MVGSKIEKEPRGIRGEKSSKEERIIIIAKQIYIEYPILTDILSKFKCNTNLQRTFMVLLTFFICRLFDLICK